MIEFLKGLLSRLYLYKGSYWIAKNPYLCPKCGYDVVKVDFILRTQDIVSYTCTCCKKEWSMCRNDFLKYHESF